VEAIRMQIRHAGMWYRSDSRFGPLFHAHLFAGEENSGKLVTQVKQASTRWAADHGRELVLVDGPPGIGCTVISASSGADLALLVTEPTVSGSHDLDRVLATTDHFGVPAIACINKWDINSERSAEIRASCEARGIPVVGMIPFDIVVVKALVQREPVTIYAPEKVVSRHLADMWTSVAQTLEKERPEATRAGQLPTA
jgi:MinD superfamily P-loop ATPase